MSVSKLMLRSRKISVILYIIIWVLLWNVSSRSATVPRSLPNSKAYVKNPHTISWPQPPWPGGFSRHDKLTRNFISDVSSRSLSTFPLARNGCGTDPRRRSLTAAAHGCTFPLRRIRCGTVADPPAQQRMEFYQFSFKCFNSQILVYK